MRRVGAFQHLCDCLDGCMAEHELDTIRVYAETTEAPNKAKNVLEDDEVLTPSHWR